MGDTPSRPQRPNVARTLTDRAGDLLAGSQPVTKIEVGRVAVQHNRQVVDNSLQKFAQLILFGIAMVGIWFGLLNIAYPGGEEVSQTNYLVLGFGGLFSGAMGISLVEFQRRKGGDELQDVHDYMLGVGFFFLAVGTLYGSRWMIGEFAIQGWDWVIPDTSIDPKDPSWYPSANAIYIQMAAVLALSLGQAVYLSNLKGRTTFGWSVAAFTPLVVALIVSTFWMDWSQSVVSYEIGISMIALASLAMWLSLRANSGIVFSVIAVTTGLLPLLYEFNNEPNGIGQYPGGALSLLVFIVGAQGVMAADKRLRQDLMQITSAVLVGTVLFYMLIARGDGIIETDYEDGWQLVLGPIVQPDLGPLEPYLTLQVALWLAVLVAYFPATLQRRIPYMPIGLAGSLCIILPEAGLIPWIVTLIMLPYLLVFSTVTREWVANATFLAAGASFFIQSYTNDGFQPEILEMVVLFGLLAVGELGRQKGNLSHWAHFLTLSIVVLSEPVLFGENWMIPWGLFLYSLSTSYLMMSKAKETGLYTDAFEASATTGGTMILAVVLSALERLELPLPTSVTDSVGNFNIALAFAGLITYLIMYRFKETELDLGVILSSADSRRKQMLPVFDTKLNAWVLPEGAEQEVAPVYSVWGPLGRASLVVPMVLFSISLVAVGMTKLANEMIWTLLMIVPIGIIVKEVLDEKSASSTGRMIATFTMIAVAYPMAFALNDSRAGFGNLEPSFLAFDLIMLSGPVLVSVLLTKKGLNDESLNKSADVATMVGLLIIGLFDASGGLLFLSMYMLVISRAMKHRLGFILSIAPGALLAFGFGMEGDRFVTDGAIISQLITGVELTAYSPSGNDIFDVSRFSYLLMGLTSFAILGKGIVDRRFGFDGNGDEMPITMPGVWLTVGMFGVLPEASWIWLSMTFILGFYSYLIGKLEFIPWTPIMTLISSMIGFAQDSNFSHFSDIDIVTHSLFLTGLYCLFLNQASSKEYLYKWADEAIDSENTISSFYISSIQGRNRLNDVLRTWTIFCLTFSWTALNGIGTTIGAIWLTYDCFTNGQKFALLGMPLLHAFSIWNKLYQFEVDEYMQDVIVGGVLFISGLLMTVLATRTDIAWNTTIFEWKDEGEFFDWIDRVGMLGIGYFLTGITWAIGISEQNQVIWTLWALYLTGIAIQGFREDTDAVWRRGIGVFGSLFSILMLALEFDTDLYMYITIMFIGVAAMGYGFAYLSRMGEVSTVFDEQSVIMTNQTNDSVMKPKSQIQGIPTPVLESGDLDEDEEEEEEIIVVKEDKKASKVIPKPVLSDDDLDEFEEEVDDDIVNFAAAVKEKKMKEAKLSQPSPSTGNYELLLDPAIANAIQSSLAATPHEGFKPVVSIAPNGNVKIDFVPI